MVFLQACRLTVNLFQATNAGVAWANGPNIRNEMWTLEKSEHFFHNSNHFASCKMTFETNRWFFNTTLKFLYVRNFWTGHPLLNGAAISIRLQVTRLIRYEAMHGRRCNLLSRRCFFLRWKHLLASQNLDHARLWWSCQTLSPQLDDLRWDLKSGQRSYDFM